MSWVRSLSSDRTQAQQILSDKQRSAYIPGRSPNRTSDRLRHFLQKVPSTPAVPSYLLKENDGAQQYSTEQKPILSPKSWPNVFVQDADDDDEFNDLIYNMERLQAGETPTRLVAPSGFRSKIHSANRFCPQQSADYHPAIEVATSQTRVSTLSGRRICPSKSEYRTPSQSRIAPACPLPPQTLSHATPHSRLPPPGGRYGPANDATPISRIPPPSASRICPPKSAAAYRTPSQSRIAPPCPLTQSHVTPLSRIPPPGSRFGPPKSAAYHTPAQSRNTPPCPLPPQTYSHATPHSKIPPPDGRFGPTKSSGYRATPTAMQGSRIPPPSAAPYCPTPSSTLGSRIPPARSQIYQQPAASRSLLSVPGSRIQIPNFCPQNITAPSARKVASTPSLNQFGFQSKLTAPRQYTDAAPTPGFQSKLKAPKQYAAPTTTTGAPCVKQLFKPRSEMSQLKLPTQMPTKRTPIQKLKTPTGVGSDYAAAVERARKLAGLGESKTPIPLLQTTAADTSQQRSSIVPEVCVEPATPLPPQRVSSPVQRVSSPVQRVSSPAQRLSPSPPMTAEPACAEPTQSIDYVEQQIQEIKNLCDSRLSADVTTSAADMPRRRCPVGTSNLPYDPDRPFTFDDRFLEGIDVLPFDMEDAAQHGYSEEARRFAEISCPHLLQAEAAAHEVSAAEDAAAVCNDNLSLPDTESLMQQQAENDRIAEEEVGRPGFFSAVVNAVVDKVKNIFSTSQQEQEEERERQRNEADMSELNVDSSLPNLYERSTALESFPEAAHQMHDVQPTIAEQEICMPSATNAPSNRWRPKERKYVSRSKAPELFMPGTFSHEGVTSQVGDFTKVYHRSFGRKDGKVAKGRKRLDVMSPLAEEDPYECLPPAERMRHVLATTQQRNSAIQEESAVAAAQAQCQSQVISPVCTPIELGSPSTPKTHETKRVRVTTQTSVLGGEEVIREEIHETATIINGKLHTTARTVTTKTDEFGNVTSRIDEGRGLSEKEQDLEDIEPPECIAEISTSPPAGDAASIPTPSEIIDRIRAEVQQRLNTALPTVAESCENDAAAAYLPTSAAFPQDLPDENLFEQCMPDFETTPPTVMQQNPQTADLDVSLPTYWPTLPQTPSPRPCRGARSKKPKAPPKLPTPPPKGSLPWLQQQRAAMMKSADEARERIWPQIVAKYGKQMEEPKKRPSLLRKGQPMHKKPDSKELARKKAEEEAAAARQKAEEQAKAAWNAMSALEQIKVRVEKLKQLPIHKRRRCEPSPETIGYLDYVRENLPPPTPPPPPPKTPTPASPCSIELQPPDDDADLSEWKEYYRKILAQNEQIRTELEELGGRVPLTHFHDVNEQIAELEVEIFEAEILADREELYFDLMQEADRSVHLTPVQERYANIKQKWAKKFDMYKDLEEYRKTQKEKPMTPIVYTPFPPLGSPSNNFQLETTPKRPVRPAMRCLNLEDMLTENLEAEAEIQYADISMDAVTPPPRTADVIARIQAQVAQQRAAEEAACAAQLTTPRMLPLPNVEDLPAENLCDIEMQFASSPARSPASAAASPRHSLPTYFEMPAQPVQQVRRQKAQSRPVTSRQATPPPATSRQATLPPACPAAQKSSPLVPPKCPRLNDYKTKGEFARAQRDYRLAMDKYNKLAAAKAPAVPATKRSSASAAPAFYAKMRAEKKQKEAAKKQKAEAAEAKKQREYAIQMAQARKMAGRSYDRELIDPEYRAQVAAERAAEQQRQEAQAAAERAAAEAYNAMSEHEKLKHRVRKFKSQPDYRSRIAQPTIDHIGYVAAMKQIHGVTSSPLSLTPPAAAAPSPTSAEECDGPNVQLAEKSTTQISRSGDNTIKEEIIETSKMDGGQLQHITKQIVTTTDPCGNVKCQINESKRVSATENANAATSMAAAGSLRPPRSGRLPAKKPKSQTQRQDASPELQEFDTVPLELAKMRKAKASIKDKTLRRELSENLREGQRLQRQQQIQEMRKKKRKEQAACPAAAPAAPEIETVSAELSEMRRAKAAAANDGELRRQLSEQMREGQRSEMQRKIQEMRQQNRQSAEAARAETAVQPCSPTQATKLASPVQQRQLSHAEEQWTTAEEMDFNADMCAGFNDTRVPATDFPYPEDEDNFYTCIQDDYPDEQQECYEVDVDDADADEYIPQDFNAQQEDPLRMFEDLTVQPKAEEDAYMELMDEFESYGLLEKLESVLNAEGNEFIESQFNARTEFLRAITNACDLNCHSIEAIRAQYAEMEEEHKRNFKEYIREKVALADRRGAEALTGDAEADCIDLDALDEDNDEMNRFLQECEADEGY